MIYLDNAATTKTDPEVMDLQNSYYPIMRTFKLGVNLDF